MSSTPPPGLFDNLELSDPDLPRKDAPTAPSRPEPAPAAPTSFPQPKRPTSGTLETKLPQFPRCKKCGEVMNEGDRICLNCGNDALLGMNVKTARNIRVASRFGVAAVAAAVVAVLGGLLWALLATWTDREFAILAWALGAAVGFAMAVASGRELLGLRGGLTAAGLAVAGICLGKILFVHWSFDTHGYDYVKNDPEEIEALAENWKMTERIAWEHEQYDDLKATGKISPELHAQLSGKERRDKVDGLLADLRRAQEESEGSRKSAPGMIEKFVEFMNLRAGQDLPEPLQKEFEQLQEGEMGARIKAHTSTEPFIKARLQELIGNTSYWDRLKATLSGFDILFFALAVISAFRLGAGMTSSSN